MKQCTNPDCQKEYWLCRIGDLLPGKEEEDVFCPYCNTFLLSVKGHLVIARKADNPKKVTTTAE